MNRKVRKAIAKSEEILEAIKGKDKIAKLKSGAKEGVDLASLVKELSQRHVNSDKV